MNTGLFELLKAVRQSELIVKFLERSSFDELLEIDLNSQSFKSIHHISKKYAMPLLHGNFKEMFIGMSEELIHPDDRERFIELMNPETVVHFLNSSEIPGLFCDEYRFRLISGGWRWVELVIVSGTAFGLERNVLHLYVFDCHSRKSRELGLDDKEDVVDNNRNEMTGLLRKRAFIKDVERRIKINSENWCLISIDIENFKLFNEWYGHNEGDLLMVQIGAALQEISERISGVAGYFGQDDFCIMMPFDMALIGSLFDEIASLIGSRGSNIGFMPAFGICKIEADVQILDMLDRAYLAAQTAKEGYHSRIRVFEKGMYSRTDEEYRVLSNFLQAIKRNEIVFYLQPQCRTSSGKIVGAEALARWVKPDGTVIPPDSFIPVLEKRGLISDLDMYIWEEVCRWQSKWIADGHVPLPISVNVSVADIQHTDLPAVFEKLAEEYSLDRKLIKIEITESSYISNTTLIRNTVRSLREKGFTVLMDDFGSGYSTLNMLKTLNIDIIKLDAQFLNIDEGNEEKSIHILESVTNMTQSIGVPIIVEGVETKEQKDFLQDIGCRYIQGYYFYQPMPTAEYEKLIADPDNIDTSGISFKSNVQFRLRELLDKDIYSDTMLNNILGPCAIYSWHGEDLDIIRYNEQFYEAVNIPNFKERLTSLQQFMPKSDLPSMYKLLHDAVSDRLNGAVGDLHFYKTDGTLTTFYMRFYYLHSDGEKKIFYGSVRNITKLSTLEKQMSLLSYISDITVLFLSRTHEGEIRFSVLFNALEPEIGMSAHELEALLNSQDLMRIIDPDKRSPDFNMILQKIIRSEPFTTQLYIKDKNGDPLPLNVTGNYIPDDTNTLDYIVTLGKKTL